MSTFLLYLAAAIALILLFNVMLVAFVVLRNRHVRHDERGPGAS